MKRVITKIGDILCVDIDGDYKCYLQFIAVDFTQLNSTVIRVFKNHYPLDSTPTMDEVVKGEVSFFAHVMLNNGIRDGVWYKVGKHKDVGDTDNIMFRQHQDIDIKTWERKDIWYVWKINHEFVRIGEYLPEEYRDLPMGDVFPYDGIIEKIKTGKFYGGRSKYE